MPPDASAATAPIPDVLAPDRNRLVGTGQRDSFAYLLLLRFAVVNVIGVALLLAAWLQGWIDIIRAGDPTHQVTAIFLVFLAGLYLCAQRVWRISLELNAVAAARPNPASKTAQYLTAAQRRGGESRSILAAALRAKIQARNAVVRHVANTLVVLGLLGTVIGFIMALSGVNPDAVGDVKAVAPMVSKLIAGMSVALYTTLVGAVLNIWLMANFHLLATGTVNLLAAIVERGESDVVGR